MNRNAIYTRVLLVLIALVVLLAFLSRSPKRSTEDAWLPSSFNPVGAGHMAMFQTLQELDWPVERWREPLSRLSTFGAGNTLIITRSPLGAKVLFSEAEADLLANWVRQGNTLILLGALGEWDDTRELLREFGFNLPDQNPSSVKDFFHPLENRAEVPLKIPPFPGSGQHDLLLIPPEAPLPSSYPPSTRVLRAQQGQPYLLDLTFGAGHVICGSSARLLSNSVLKEGENLPIVLGLLAPGGKVPRHLFFEESHHGFSAVFALVRLLHHPGVSFAGMLALLGVLTFLVSSFVRFGPVLPLHPLRGRSTLEFVDSIADLYQRADLRNDMIGYLFRETQQRVLQRLNLPVTATHAQIADRLQQSYPHLPKWKKLAQRFDSHDYVNGLPPTGWLRLARELIEIKSAMA